MENKGSFIKKLIITIVIMLFILFCASQKQAHALALKSTTNSPAMVESERKNGGTYGNDNGTISTTLWYSTHFQDTWTIDNDYDLAGFKIIRFNYVSYRSESFRLDGEIRFPPSDHTNWVYSDIYFDTTNFIYAGDNSYITVFGYMQTNEGNVACYTTSELENYVLCPIHRGLQIYQFWVEIAVNTSYGYNLRIDYEVRNERTYYNYDNTQVVQQQQQTNDILSGTDTTGAGTDTTNFFDNNSSQFNSEINSLTNEGDLVNLGVVFLTQIDNSTCQPFNIPIPYTTKSIQLPCLGTEFQNKVPLLWTLYTTIITGVIVFRFWTYAIDMIKHLVDPYSTGLTGVTDIAGGGK